MRSQFNAFFASLLEVERGMFMDDSLQMWHSAMDDGTRHDVPSIADAMENVYDQWRTWARETPRAFDTTMIRAIRQLMNDPARIKRERNYLNAT